MRIPLYQIDAFTDRPLAGNPAAVMPLDTWLPDPLLQALAAENNLSETAFFVGGDGVYRLRWFTPATEVDLCGHATLASAFVVFSYREPKLPAVRFDTASGELSVERSGARLMMDFPSRPGAPCEAADDLLQGLGARPVEVQRARDLLTVFATEDEVRGLAPDFATLRRLDCLGIIATAPGRECDFVSRFFAPRVGIDEDPATGSSHCTLTPYWSQRLGRTSLHARQLSARGGEFWCEDRGERVSIAGKAVVYLEGSALIPGG